MRNNKLVLNSDKTHLLIMASPNKHRKHGNFGITLNTGKERIEPIDSEILLGATLSNNFMWNQHIRDGEQAMIHTLNRKNTALKKISQTTDFKTRNMIGSGLVMSSLSYIIQVYGGCSNYLLNLLQVQQNNAARHITKLPWMTSTKVLLNQCNWLSVRQLVVYHSMILLHGVLLTQKPNYIFKKLGDIQRETRNTDSNSILDRRKFKTTTAQRSYIPRAISRWNSLPLEIREIRTKSSFKQELKKYTKENIPVK